jgi:hypothetical protein
LECDFTGGSPAAATVWLVGDSHAQQWKTAVHELARQNKWIVKESLLGGCPLVDVKKVAFDGAPVTDKGDQEGCLSWSRTLSDRILADQPDIIFLSSYAAAETIDDGSGRPQIEQYGDGFTERVVPWADAGAEIFVLRDPPLTLNRATPDCLSKNREAPLTCSNDETRALAIDPLAEAAKADTSGRIKVLDLSDQFCRDGRCYASIGGAHVYFDEDHITSTYMRSLIPALAERFNASRG